MWPHHIPLQVTVAGLCRDSGYLFSCGVVTQLGSAVGALVMFILVNKVGAVIVVLQKVPSEGS